MNFYIHNIVQYGGECIFTPANGRGIIKNGISVELVKRGGRIISDTSRQECFKNGFLKPGEAFATPSGDLIYSGIESIIHLVIKSKDDDKTNIDICRKAIISGIILAKQSKIKSIAIPSIGIQARHITFDESAKMMIETLRPFDKEIKISIIDKNIDFVTRCKNYWNSYD